MPEPGTFSCFANVVVDEILVNLGGSACKVYLYLCRWSDGETGECYRSQATIASDLGMSERTCRAALAELSEAGAIESKNRGRTSNLYTVKPARIRRIEEALTGEILPDESLTGKNTSLNRRDSAAYQDLVSKQESTNDQSVAEKKRKKQGPRAYSEGFGAFWDEYPRKVAKPAAADAFAAAVHRLVADSSHAEIATEADAAEYLSGQAKAFAQSPAAKDPQFTPHASTWLNKDRFDDCEVRPHPTASQISSGLHDADALRKVFGQAVGSGFVDKSEHGKMLYCVGVAEIRRRNGRRDDLLCHLASLATLDRAGQERRIEQHRTDAAAVYDLLRGSQP